MNLKVASVIGGVSLIAAGYYTGVYMTGKAFDEELVKLQDSANVYLEKIAADSALASHYKLEFKVDESNFHFRHFNTILTNEKTSVKIEFPMSATIGFLSATIDANKVSDEVIQELQNNSDYFDLGLDFQNMEMTTKVYFSVLPQGFEYASNIKHTNGRKDFHMGIKGEINEKDEHNYTFIVKDYEDEYSKIEELKIEGVNKNYEIGSDVGSYSLQVKNIITEDLGKNAPIEELNFNLGSSKIQKDGSFTLILDAKAKSFMEQQNIDLSTNIDGFKVYLLEKIKKLYDINLSADERNEIYSEVLKDIGSTLLSIKINKFNMDAQNNLILEEKGALYPDNYVPINVTGTAELHLSPWFIFDPKTKLDLVVTTDKNAGTLLNELSDNNIKFKEEGDKSVAHIEYEKNEFKKN